MNHKMNQKKAEALEFFFDYQKRMPNREDWQNNCFAKKLTKLYESYLYQSKNYFYGLIEELGGSLKVRESEIPESINIMDILLTMMDLGMTDEMFFDMSDQKTFERLQLIKKENRWDPNSKISDNIVTYLF